MSIATYNSETIPIVSIPPDWDTSIKFDLLFKTDIAEALSNKEERQARFPGDFWALRYDSATLSEQESGYLRQFLETVLDMPVGCPMWPFAARLTAGISPGATSLSVDDTTDCQFDQRPFALIWESFDNWEVVQLDTVGTNTLTLFVATTTGTFTTAARVMPLAYGLLARSSTKPQTDELSNWSCDFTEKALALEYATANAPAAPSGLALSNIFADRIKLDWTDNASNELGFSIQRRTGIGGTWAQIATTSANVVTYTDNTPLDNVSYYYRVFAFNAVEYSTASNTANATTLNAITGLSVTSSTDTSITLSFTNNNAHADSLSVERKTGVGGTWAEVGTPAGNATGYTASGLAALTTYYFRVRAKHGAVYSAYSGEANGTTSASTATAYGDDFDAYSDGSAPGTLSGGTGFSGNWLIGA